MSEIASSEALLIALGIAEGRVFDGGPCSLEGTTAAATSYMAGAGGGRGSKKRREVLLEMLGEKRGDEGIEVDVRGGIKDVESWKCYRSEDCISL